ncbi:MAG: hypothetical protein M1830_006664 [Pleopsidium flavum]|nr:MAG: hypothetical protein M1830_006664 [Pleopsidium flavum]
MANLDADDMKAPIIQNRLADTDVTDNQARVDLDAEDEKAEIVPSSPASQHRGSIKAADAEYLSPFQDSNDPQLDPRSGAFSSAAWFKAVAGIKSRHPDRYSSGALGVSYRDLNVHGFRTSTDYQQTFGNYPMALASVFNKLVGRGKTKVEILRNIDGLVKSGEMLVVLGRPGSGCSTLLKSLAGETHGIFLGSQSKLNYQGTSPGRMHTDYRGECTYTAELDVHFPELTVGQTLGFAAEARAPSDWFPEISKKNYVKHLRDVMIAMFNLTHAVDTKMGNDFVRGVSGGERKRVSIAEALMGWRPLQCWDNSTRGLDSSTALGFVRNLRLFTDTAGSAAIVSVYQASQAIYDVFDKVTVLYEGRQIYFGRADSAKAYFIRLGFVCPGRATTGDFLTSLTNPAEAE